MGRPETRRGDLMAGRSVAPRVRAIRMQWRVPGALAALTLLAGVGFWLMALRAPVQSEAGRGAGSIDHPKAFFEDASGLRVKRVAVLGAGGLVDLRYQVIDPDKAAIVHEPDQPPTIIDEATGTAVNRLWMAHSLDHELVAGV